MKIKHKHFDTYWRGFANELPRKIKKALIGKRMPKSKLKRLINSVHYRPDIDPNAYRMEILPYEFCPNCGHTSYRGSGNKAEYPEHWEIFKCLKCKHEVGYIDNSAFIHVLEEIVNDKLSQ